MTSSQSGMVIFYIYIPQFLHQRRGRTALPPPKHGGRTGLGLASWTRYSDFEILGGFLGLRPSRPLGIFVCIDGKDCEKDALVG